jgi:hypothetical protein
MQPRGVGLNTIERIIGQVEGATFYLKKFEWICYPTFQIVDDDGR